MKPKISVITPRYNMANTIELTINSIVNQNYPNLEYILVDGLSTDGTINIINKYKDKIELFISESDKGQYDAIKKGMNHATGDILCWLNVDDIYFPWTLNIVANIFEKNPEINWISGIPAFLDKKGCLSNIYNAVSAKPSKFIKEG